MRVALPNKGRLSEDVRTLLAEAGLDILGKSQRALTASLGGGYEAIFVRAQDIPEFLADGAADVGITGWDILKESGLALTQLVDLELGRCRLVAAAREDSGVRNVESIPKGARIATSFPRLTAEWIKRRAPTAIVVPVSGSTEIAPHLGIADLIVDLTSTGSTLKVNGLAALETILESTARLVAAPSKASDPRAQALALALSSVVHARTQRYILANVPRESLAQVRNLIPGLNGPTLSEIVDSTRFVAMQAVVPAESIFTVVGDLKALGCEGILVMRIERSVP